MQAAGNPALRRTPERQAVYEQCLRLFEKGEKTAIISRTYGVPPQTVCQWRKAYTKRKARASGLTVHNGSTNLPMLANGETEITAIGPEQSYRDKLQLRALSGLSATESMQESVARGLGNIQSIYEGVTAKLTAMISENVQPIVITGEYGVLVNYAPLSAEDYKSIAATADQIAKAQATLHCMPHFLQAQPKDPIIKPGAKHMHLHQHAGAGSRPVGKVIYKHDAPHIPSPPSTASSIDADLVTVIDAQIVED